MNTPDECSCDDCKSACTTKPGWFTPDQIAPLAEALNVTEEVLFNEHLQVDWWTEYPNDVFVLSPRLKNHDGGTMFPGNPRGSCHWFVDGKCEIHDKGKPFECAALGHINNKWVSADREKEIVDLWRDEAAQQKIKDLLGSEPTAEEFSVLNSFGSF